MWEKKFVWLSEKDVRGKNGGMSQKKVIATTFAMAGALAWQVKEH